TYVRLLLFSTHPAPTNHFTLSLHERSSDLALRLHEDQSIHAVGHMHRHVGHRTVVDVQTRIQRTEHKGFFFPRPHDGDFPAATRSEEHTSELQSRENLVCRLLLEKKKLKQS